MRGDVAAGLIVRAHEIAVREEVLGDVVADAPARARVAQEQGHHDVALLAHLVAEVVQHSARPRRIRLRGRVIHESR
jgi:hypothetical protein